MEKEPLVSIFIGTYNSSKYILDALEGAKAQTYQNIELLVSDDCSTDNTVSIAKNWLEENRSRFVDVRLLTVDKNTGVSGNVNRAIKACKGVWIKGCAGDDILMPNCIEDNIKFVNEYPEAKAILSNSIVFFDTDKRKQAQFPGRAVRGFFDMNASEQYENLVRHNEIALNPNSQFLNAELFYNRTVDERIKNMEDRQFYWDITAHGVKIYYLDKFTVRYRKHEGALTGYAGKKLISVAYWDSWTDFYYLIRKPAMEKLEVDIGCAEKQVLYYLFAKYILKNKGNIFNRFVLRLLSKFYLKAK